MKKLLITLLIAMSSMVYAQKLATVDMDKTFLKYYKTINAEKKLKKQVRIMEDRAVEMERRHKSIISEYEKLMSESASIVLSDEARKKKKEMAEEKKIEIRRMEKSMRSFNKDARDMIAKQHNDSRKDILKEIQKVIEMISKNRAVDLVVDSSGKTSNLIPSVVYAKEELDITEEVLKLLNKGHEKEVAEWEKEKEMKKKEAEAKKAAAEKGK